MDNPQKHPRRSIRLPGYDYQNAGAYFVTLCTQNRQCLFGEIAGGEMVLNDAGRMVQRVWNELPLFYPGVDIDAIQIMPNHFHGIVIPVGEHTGVWQPQRVAPTKGPSPGNKDWKHNSHVGAGACPGPGQPRGVAPTDRDGERGNGLSLPDVVHRFKTMTTKKYTDGVKQSGWPFFPGKLWQRNYFERVIRDIDELVQIQQYILDNPQKWEFDRENPRCLVLDTLPPGDKGR
jgi:REP element-mobilizing transposase RayT